MSTFGRAIKSKSCRPPIDPKGQARKLGAVDLCGSPGRGTASERPLGAKNVVGVVLGG